MAYHKTVKIAEGKTKTLWQYADNHKIVVVENKNNITAFDNPAFTKRFDTKAVYATTTTCRVFELLKKAEIPVAYIEQDSPTEFAAKKCVMLPFEVVARRYAIATGSYVKRNPNLRPEEGKPPHRFHKVEVEFFLKTTKGRLINPFTGEVILEGLDPEKGEEDPLVLDPWNAFWILYHPKKPLWDPSARLDKCVNGTAVASLMGEVPSLHSLADQMYDYATEVFLVLEGMWQMLGHRLIDLKLEFGVDDSGKLFVADVIDNDSWRVTTPDWVDISKQAFRDGKDMATVENNYGLVAKLVEQFRIPRQCLVLWRGSEKDDYLKVGFNHNNTYDKFFGEFEKKSMVAVELVTLSGHKSPQKCIAKLEELMAKYPEGGVTIARVGMSNGLGPLLAARTIWPVITIPASLGEFPNDIWSNIRMPSEVPLTVVASDNNALHFALNILARKNPILYMRQQQNVEMFDI